MIPLSRAWFERVAIGEPGRADEAFLRRFDRWLGPWLRLWFRPTLCGVEHLPERGPYLIVANHSGGGLAEVLCLVLAWWRRFGTSRPAAGFAHPIAFRMPWTRGATRALGMVPSTYAGASAALSRGVPLVLFPGGDHEAFRPIWQARRVDFAGRKGFLRIARDHRASIVPLAISGSHVTVPILWRSRAMTWLLLWPRLCGLRRVPVTLLGAVLCAAGFWAGHAAAGPWAGALAAWLSWTVVPSPFLAWVPSRIRMRLLPPIPAEEIAADLDAAYARVTGAIARALREPPPDIE